MISYVDKHIIDFVDKWGDKILPQLDKLEYQDLTKVFSKSKKCRIVLDAIKEGKKAFIIGFYGCRGMIRKWLYDEKGRMLREKGRGIISINPSVIAIATIDIVVPFISSDEILLAKHPKDRPYNLEKEIVKEAMTKAGFNSEKDIIFIFFVRAGEIQSTINRFIDELKYMMTREYCRAKGILAIKDPKWIKYHAQDKVTPFTNAFFFGGVRLIYIRRETLKNNLKLWRI